MRCRNFREGDIIQHKTKIYMVLSVVDGCYLLEDNVGTELKPIADIDDIFVKIGEY